jgi:mRNA interferase MazF
VRFPEKQPPGREQEGERPAILVALPDCLGKPRFPMLLVLPLTTYRAQPWAVSAPKLYPSLNAGAGNLSSPFTVLLDQLCAVDRTRVRGYIGTLTTEQFAPIQAGLKQLFRDVLSPPTA